MIFIPENVPSSKNSRFWTGKQSIASPAVQKWRKDTSDYFILYKQDFYDMIVDKSKPFRIGFHFVRSSKHRYDWVNPVQTIQDAMVKHGWIDDDNIKEMVPFPMKLNGDYTSYDKDNPGVYIKVFK